MKLSKPITALLLVFLGQSIIFIQHYLNHHGDHSSHAKISASKSNKQSVSRLPSNKFSPKEIFLAENQNNQRLEIKIIKATVAEFLTFNFNSIKPIWFGCCGNLRTFSKNNLMFFPVLI